MEYTGPANMRGPETWDDKERNRVFGNRNPFEGPNDLGRFDELCLLLVRHGYHFKSQHRSKYVYVDASGHVAHVIRMPTKKNKQGAFAYISHSMGEALIHKIDKVLEWIGDTETHHTKPKKIKPKTTVVMPLHKASMKTFHKVLMKPTRIRLNPRHRMFGV